MINRKEIISKTELFVREQLICAEGGHDWHHTQRVWKNAQYIGSREDVDLLIVELGALLHDIADPKFHNGNDEVGPAIAAKFLSTLNLPSFITNHALAIVRHVGYKGGHGNEVFDSPELQVVQDADRLDAIGAIGIARCFNYGGFKNRAIYDPEIPPQENMTPEEYRKSKGPSINHFYEKLLKLKDGMHTGTGKLLAEERHKVMEDYLKQFFREIEGQA